MKRFGVVLFALILGGTGGYFAWRYLAGQSQASTVFGEHREPFMWGVDVNPSAIGNYNIETWTRQIKYVKELGAGWIRLSFDNEPANKFQIFDEMINYAKSQNLEVYLGLGSTKPVTSIDDTYKDGYKVASEVASHYKGKIKYYQLMSESGSTAIKGPQYSGENESDYDLAKYKKVKEWMRGASDAIRKIDPSAYLVITDQWTHYAYFDMLAKDKIDYDIIGWDWYSGMGAMGDRKLFNGMHLVDKLKSYNKPIILAEVNFTPDARTGIDQQTQSNFIKQIAEWAYNSGYIKGFFVFKLVDYKPTPSNPNDCCALVKFKAINQFGDKRQAFDTYAEIIKKYSK